MAWIMLLLAGLFEIACTTLLKLSVGFTKVIPTIAFTISAILSFYCLNRSLDKIPLGTAYLMWTSIGAIGTVIVGIISFNEPCSLMRMFFIITTIISIIGLKLS